MGRPITPSRAATELISRRRARDSLIDYAQYIDGRYRVNWHHKEIAEALDAIVRGELFRVIIQAPPRSGKSELVSVKLPTYYIGRRPTDQILAVSYSDELSQGFGRRVRNIVSDDYYQNLFSVHLAKDSKAKNLWHTTAGGVYSAAGIGGSLHGKGANLLIVDDPTKNRQEADSKRHRERIWSIYKNDLLSRLMPNAAIVIMHTRWSTDDLVARVLNDAESNEWTVLSYPAIQNEGTDQEEAIWDDYFPLKELRRTRKTLGPQSRSWQSIYQQNPQPDAGSFFDLRTFGQYDVTPANDVQYYVTADFAVRENKELQKNATPDDHIDPDFTEIAVWAVKKDAEEETISIYAVDWWFGQTKSIDWIEKIIDFLSQYKPMLFAGEGGVIRHAIEPILLRRMRERHTYCKIDWLNPVHDKETRARSFQALAFSGRIHFPKAPLPWVRHVREQLAAFPAGAHDDAVDACSLMGMIVDRMHEKKQQHKPSKSHWRVA